MADTLEEEAAPSINNDLLSLQSVLDMTVAEYLTTSLDRDLSTPSAASAEPAMLPPYLPPYPLILIAEYTTLGHPMTHNGRQVVIMRSKVESWKEPDVIQNLCNALKVTKRLDTSFKVSLSIHESGGGMSIDVGSWEDLFPYITKLWLVNT
ncbi:hypothetical protein FIBSPDRAFT_1004181 [Athelia psychrophila]|uniref:Uncharacterized protein n=1 Tax=Athelia psychrophila TaxID=1759441 RepID=A0A167W3G7_9AGAM|nr:hypothetical protein FIBSPDRAFT_1004181 [Fibularhizoctonia sp. CBS 109695]